MTDTMKMGDTVTFPMDFPFGFAGQTLTVTAVLPRRWDDELIGSEYEDDFRDDFAWTKPAWEYLKITFYAWVLVPAGLALVGGGMGVTFWGVTKFSLWLAGVAGTPNH